MRVRTSIVFALFSISAAPAFADAQSSAEAFTVRFRHPVAFCAGACAHFEMRVTSDGNVVTRNDLVDRTFRFRVNRSQLSGFRRILAQLFVYGSHEYDSKCEPAFGPDGAPDDLYDPHIDDVEVRWSYHGTSQRVAACRSNSAVEQRVKDALMALGADFILGSKAGRDISRQ